MAGHKHNFGGLPLRHFLIYLKRLADLLLSLPILVPIAICGAFASIHRRSGVPTLGEANCYFALL